MRKSLSKRSRTCLKLAFLSLLASCGGGGGGSSDGPAMYSVGGAVSGLAGTLVLQLNGGGDTSILANSGFTFPTSLADGTTYAVTVLTQPAAQNCSVANGVGDLAGANVTSVAVTCGPSSFSVGGTISGLAGTVVLQDNGGDNLSRSADGNFTFAAPVADLGAYAVTVLTQPAGQVCSVASSSGTLASANVTNIAVTCSATSLSVGGTISGLNGTVVLQNNGGDNLIRATNGPFTFAAPVAQGSAYSVTALSKPAKQSCTVTAGSGTIAGASVTSVAVACIDYNVMFVTSTTSTGNLGGLAGADAKCNALAGAAGLPGTYAAWLGTSNPPVTPDQRLGTARGWVRPDGLPFADTVGDLGIGKTFYPPRITELNAPAAPGRAYTGSDRISNCSNWTSELPDDFGAGGNPDAGGTGWTDHGSVSTSNLFFCSGQSRIYCFGVGAAAPLTFAPVAGKLIFLSTSFFSPNGGLAGADAICQSEANTAKLPGSNVPKSYGALLAAGDGRSPLTTFSRIAGPPSTPWVRPDGVIVVADILPEGDPTTTLMAPINVSATKTYFPGQDAWVGAASFTKDSVPLSTCNGWTVNNTSGVGAVTFATDFTAFSGSSHTAAPACNTGSRRLICLQR